MQKQQEPDLTSSEGELESFTVQHFKDLLPERLALVTAFLSDSDAIRCLCATRALWQKVDELDVRKLLTLIENSWSRIRDRWLRIQPGTLPVLHPTLPAFLYALEQRAATKGIAENYFHGLPGKDYQSMISYLRQLAQEVSRLDLDEFVNDILTLDEAIMRQIRSRALYAVDEEEEEETLPRDLPEDPPPFHGGGDVERVASNIASKGQ